jgi:SAM-dependent methyltransferase
MQNLISLINKFTIIKFVNIGSGPKPWVGWKCLDEVTAPGVTYCEFSQSAKFPIETNSINLVYSSHCLEHLEDKTVSRLLRETNRILKNNGVFLVKLPDFDWFLSEYRKKNPNFMDDIIRFWPSWSWKNFDIEDTTLNRMSYMFCGYWNHAYGDHFSNNINNSPHSYNGPAKINKNELIKLFDKSNIREISKFLKNEILKEEDFKSFNHQNAWSKRDLFGLLESHNFSIVDSNKTTLIEKYENIIPDIKFMGHWSMYVLAKKNEVHVNRSS